MRTIGDVRQMKIRQLGLIVAKPRMMASNGREMELQCRSVLQDLCFIDGRETEHTAAERRLHRFGKLGVVGAFDAVFGSASDHLAEVQSAYAEVFHALGYLELGPRLPTSRWEKIRAGLVEAHALTDTRHSAIVAAYGEPTLALDGRVLCYVSDGDPAEWIFFDCWSPRGDGYREGRGDQDADPPADPLLRDIRVPAPTFEGGLILSLWGKFQRWGPTWRLHHPEHAGGGWPPGVREQLLAIEAADPSQSLGTRRR